MTNNRNKHAFIVGTLAALGLIGAVCAGSAAAAPLSLANMPLALTTGVDPNIIVTLDDSGSMASAYVPDTLYAGTYSTVANRFTSSTYNGMAYNPSVTYQAPVDASGTALTTSFTHAWINGFDQSRGWVDLSTNYQPTLTYYPNSTGQTFAPATTAQAAYYYVYDTTLSSCPSGGGVTNDACYRKVVVGSSEEQNFANWYSFYRTRNLSVVSGASLAFANVGNNTRIAWQNLHSCDGFNTSCSGWDGSTYDSRIKAFGGTHRQDFYDWLFRLPASGGTPLRAAVQRAGNYYTQTGLDSPYAKDPFVQDTPEYSCRQNFQVVMTDGLWNGSLSGGPGNADGTSATLPDSTAYSPIPPYADSTSDTLADLAFHYWSTDLVSGLNNTVRQYMPDKTGTPTDQYWNARNDPATWQHMVNFTVGLGLSTILTSPLPTWGGDTYSGSYPNLAAPVGSTSPTHMDWPAASSNSTNNVADLWHAAIDSRGEFFAADNPKSLSDAFKTILQRIAQRTSSASAVGLDSTSLSTPTAVYYARYNSTDWSGQLLDVAINTTAGSTTYGQPLWNGSGPLGSQWDAGSEIPSASNRKIVTFKPSTRAGIPFEWPASATSPTSTELDTSQISDLNGTDGLGSERLSYLRGDQSNEKSSGGTFRTRSSLLGDIVHSSPAYVGPPSRYYPSSWVDQECIASGGTTSSCTGSETDYSTFKSNNSSREAMVYVGANDGMLHAFDATTGVEQFAFVPSGIYGNLADLTDPSYSHEYFVDGSPTSGDAFFGGAWHTMLVGGLRGGGQAIYALDVTDPTATSESNLSNKVLWEFNDDPTLVGGKQYGDADLGYTYSQPRIARLHDGKWVAIFGNGYNNTTSDSHTSSTGDAVLYIVDLQTGALIKKIDTMTGTAQDPLGAGRPDGLATPTLVDADGDNIIDYVYAGDLFGNMWAFDLTSSNPANWKVEYGTTSAPKPLFTAVDASGNPQPITSAPSVVHAPAGSGFLVMFGTGKYLETSDKSPDTSTVQSFYGVWDRLNPSTFTTFTRSNLLQQTISTSSVNQFGMTERVVSDNPIQWYTGTGLPPAANPSATPYPIPATYLGWYLDLQTSGSPPEGEIQYTDSVVAGDAVAFTSLIPNSDPCALGGTPWLMILDWQDGGRLPYSAFDLNNDGQFSSADYVLTGSVPASGLSIPAGGPIQTPRLISQGNGTTTGQLAYGGGIWSPIMKLYKSVPGRQSWTTMQSQ